MHRMDAAAPAGNNAPAARPVETPVQLVCLALLLAIATLACRIVSLW